MRYLTQLARETTARVAPPRGPSWLAPTPASASFEADAPPSIAPRQSESGAAVDASPTLAPAAMPVTHEGTSTPRPLRVDPMSGDGSPRDEAMRPARTPAIPAPARPPAIVPAAASPRPGADAPSVASPRVQATKPASSFDPLPSAPPVASPPIEPARPRAGHPLDAVLAELGRRQAALDARRHLDIVDAPDPPPRRAEAAAARIMPPAAPRVEIGTIVVQVEGEPAAAPRAAPRIATRRPADGWRRSFLDR